MTSSGQQPGNLEALAIEKEMDQVLHCKRGTTRLTLPNPSPEQGLSGKVFGLMAKVLLSPLLCPLGQTKRKYTFQGDVIAVKRPLWWRLLDGLAARVLLAPIILAIFLIVVMHSNTHPTRIHASITPASMGLHFKRAQLVTVDDQVLRGWYIPPVSVMEMATNPQVLSLRKWPAVVLCHGMGTTHEQYLVLAEQLHRAGFAVLMLDMRGLGASDPAAVTYGLREPLDVLAGVQYLRELPNIDSSKVCVIGRDIGAMAALQAAALDSTIAAVVVDGLWPRFEERARNIFAQPGGWNIPLDWLAPLYTVTFEMAMQDRVQRLDPMAMVRRLHSRPAFFVARQGDDFMPLEEVMTLATNIGSPHEIMIAGPGAGHGAFEARVSEFLKEATGWKGMGWKEN
ncbi:MAG: alpha/beta fold hydrolase [Phycisphaerales bacterium]|nr:alpha/beta fold hydrolase [Phycisphaerales bacterium]